MNIKDFKGISYFRFLVPVLYIFCWSSMFLAPKYASLLYREYGFIILIYFVVKTFYQLVLTVNFVLEGNAVLNRAKNPQMKESIQMGQPYQQIYHAFAIPSYKQDIELIAETLEVLAQHKRAAYSYLIFLAMEEHEDKSDEKAKELIRRFNSKFRCIDYTRHKVRELQAKGKASNVSWCVQHMAEKFQTLMINEDDVLVTIIDADSWAPNAYFDEVQTHLYKNLEDRHVTIYQPSQIFTRNNMDVPVFVRTYDDMFSSFHAASMAACCGLTFSFSNYSLSYKLLRRIGFWDTNEQAIAEDFHMCLKAHFKTNGELKTVPIYAPFNQLNIQTGNGYCEDIKAKFWQLQRHGRALLEMGYCILMFFRTSLNFKSLVVVLTVLDNFLMPIIIPYAVMSNIFYDQVLHFEAPGGILAPINFTILLNVTNFMGVLMCLLCDYNKRKSSKILYGIQSPSILRALEGPLLIFVNAVFVLTATYVTSSFRGLKKNQEYIVAEKAVTITNKVIAEKEIHSLTQVQIVLIEEEQKVLLESK